MDFYCRSTIIAKFEWISHLLVSEANRYTQHLMIGLQRHFRGTIINGLR